MCLFSNENPEICHILEQTLHNTFQVREKTFIKL